MSEKFCLSDKRLKFDEFEKCYHEIDIMEFIRLLKEVVKAGEYTQSEFLEQIDKLVGEGLR